MTTLPAARCNLCRFWLEELDCRDPNDADGGMGWCRRHPPIVLDHMARMTIPHLGNSKDNYDPEDVATVMNVNSATIFPATPSTGWCGDFDGRAT